MKLAKILARDGRFPPVKIRLTKLDDGSSSNLDRFVSYSFNSSIIVPVDAFQFDFRLPDDKDTTIADVAQDGDIATLYANNQKICKGIIDNVSLSVNTRNGESGAVVGRNMLAQLEDNESISIESSAIFGNNLTIDQVLQKFLKDTRIDSNYDVTSNDGPTGPNLFATSPGESRMQSLMRYLEPLNCLIWMKPNGQVIVGKPNFNQAPQGTLFCNRYKTPVGSNILDIAMQRGSTTIPNTITSVWTGAENIPVAYANTSLVNSAKGPDRLRQQGHNVIKTVVISSPDVNSVQGLTDANRLASGYQSYLQSWAKRMIAAENRRELDVTITCAGHYNEAGNPFLIDQVYNVMWDRANLDTLMYVYAVDYSLTPAEGQRTTLHLCNLQTIVADTKATTSADNFSQSDLGAGIA